MTCARCQQVDEVETLLAAGEAATQIANQIGRTVGAMSRFLYRQNRPDLARPFEQEARAAERQRSHHRVREVAA